MRRLAAVLFAGCIACAITWPAHALDEPQPDAALAATEGAWTGSLTYRDYRLPDHMVTLPTRLFVALAARDTVDLHYVFDDGPGKTVHSYERIRFDLAAQKLAWTTGDAVRTETTYRIVSTDRAADTTRVVFEGPGKGDAAGGTVRFTIELGAARVTQKKEEVDAQGGVVVRNTFAFARVAAGG